MAAICASADLRAMKAWAMVRRRKVTSSLGRTWPIFQSSVEMMVAGHTKPPSEGPSTVSTTGWSPVKLMAPRA